MKILGIFVLTLFSLLTVSHGFKKLGHASRGHGSRGHVSVGQAGIDCDYPPQYAAAAPSYYDKPSYNAAYEVPTVYAEPIAYNDVGATPSAYQISPVTYEAVPPYQNNLSPVTYESVPYSSYEGAAPSGGAPISHGKNLGAGKSVYISIQKNVGASPYGQSVGPSYGAAPTSAPSYQSYPESVGYGTPTSGGSTSYQNNLSPVTYESVPYSSYGGAAPSGGAPISHGKNVGAGKSVYISIQKNVDASPYGQSAGPVSYGAAPTSAPSYQSYPESVGYGTPTSGVSISYQKNLSPVSYESVPYSQSAANSGSTSYGISPSSVSIAYQKYPDSAGYGASPVSPSYQTYPDSAGYNTVPSSLSPTYQQGVGVGTSDNYLPQYGSTNGQGVSYQPTYYETGGYGPVPSEYPNQGSFILVSSKKMPNSYGLGATGYKDC